MRMVHVEVRELSPMCVEIDSVAYLGLVGRYAAVNCSTDSAVKPTALERGATWSSEAPTVKFQSLVATSHFTL